jgi:hypothetical protein
MGASYSRPGCRACAEMPDSIGCGVCSNLSDQTATTTRKRRESTKRAFKRRGLSPSNEKPTRAVLLCANGHRWHSEATPGRDDAVEQPKCDICGLYHKTISFVNGILDSTIECRDDCKRAKNFECICSCGGAAHGIALVGINKTAL